VGNLQRLRRQYSGRLKSITVVSIQPQVYPQFAMDKDHKFVRLPDEQRIEEIVRVCASALVQQTLCPEPPESGGMIAEAA